MTNIILQDDETILYRGSARRENGNSAIEVILTNLRLVLVATINRVFAKSQCDVDVYAVKDVKFYNDMPQVKQKNTLVEVFLIGGEVTIVFNSSIEAAKFANAMLQLLTGKTVAARGAQKVKETVGLVDDTLGINTVDTVKNVLEYGLANSLLGGFGKKTSAAAKDAYAVKEVVSVAKELIERKLPETSATSTSSATLTAEQMETVKMWKELLDMGIITQEEFDTKKKLVLDL